MCLVTFQYKLNDDYPLILVQNRDEFYERPSLPLHQWADFPHVLAGRDKKHGGTWSGVTLSGRFASLTNHPFTDFSKNGETKSRGLLVKDYLTDDSQPEAVLNQLKDHRFNYDSYHLLFGTIDNLYMYSNATNDTSHFQAGTHAVSNTYDELSNHKKDRSRLLLTDYLSGTSEPRLNDLITLFKDDVPVESISHVPDGLTYDNAMSASPIFIKGNEFGTVNTTALLVHKSGRVTIKEVRYNQNGVMEETEKSFHLKTH